MYHFTKLPNFQDIRQPLINLCKSNGIKGTLLLASEGINGTVSGTRAGIDNLLTWFKSKPEFKGLEHKESFTDNHPFCRMKVKLKKEIVTLGVDGIDPTKEVGVYVEPSEWNDLISDPDVIVVDTRNKYETDIGTFKGALLPDTDSFREFPKYVHDNMLNQKDKKVAMFCTGGIRCEKSTAYMLQQGFRNVYHLKGGILKYLEEVEKKDSLWEGECFVFDDRVAVDNDLKPGKYDQCHGCRNPITPEDIKSPLYVKGVSCPNCADKLTPEQKSRFAERQKQIDISKKHSHNHIGADISKLKAIKTKKKLEHCEKSKQQQHSV